MKARISRWGNSLALRIPKVYAKRMGLEDGASVELTARGDALVIRRPEYTLDELLAKVTRDNLRSEADWGPAKGREAW